MTRYYELATLRIALGGAGKAAAAVERWVGAGAGTLYGAWAADIGALNEIHVLRGFDNLAALAQERERALRSDDPFGCVALLAGLSMDSHVGLDFLPGIETGARGPIYEIRCYRMKPNGLVPTLEKWKAAVPERAAYSPLAVAMYSLDGEPRLTQIWPYPSLEARTRARAQSVADGKWPPRGGPDWLQPAMSSTIALPLPFSPLA